MHCVTNYVNEMDQSEARKIFSMRDHFLITGLMESRLSCLYIDFPHSMSKSCNSWWPSPEEKSTTVAKKKANILGKLTHKEKIIFICGTNSRRPYEEIGGTGRVSGAVSVWAQLWVYWRFQQKNTKFRYVMRINQWARLESCFTSSSILFVYTKGLSFPRERTLNPHNHLVFYKPCLQHEEI